MSESSMPSSPEELPVTMTVAEAVSGPCIALAVEQDHLFRHLTEVNGTDTRGGYIEGSVQFSDILLMSSVAVKVSLVGAAERQQAGGRRGHPNLLYMTRMEGGKRVREKESAAPMWRIELEISDSKVYWWTESESQPLYKQHICSLRPGPGSLMPDTLDLKDLHLTVITPLVRTNVNGIRVRDGLAMRRPLFEEELPDDQEWEKVLTKMDKFFLGKEGKPEMDRVCLQFDLHRMSGGSEELEPLCPPVISNPIVNTKSRALGSLELHGMISAQKACCQYSRTIFLPSKFKLPASEKECYPRFVVQFRPGDVAQLDERVRQPTDVKIFAGQVFVFQTPVQEEENIRQVYQDGGTILVEAYRPRDRQSSSVKLEFQFKVNCGLGEGGLEWCSLCLEDPDKLDGRDGGESLKQRLAAQGEARPGTKRRRQGRASPDSSTANQSPLHGFSGARSPLSTATWSPASVTSTDRSTSPSQDELMEDIASLMPDSGLENNPVPIETLLGVDDLLPDVLRGVVGGVGTPSVPHPQPASLLCLPGEEEGGAAQGPGVRVQELGRRVGGAGKAAIQKLREAGRRKELERPDGSDCLPALVFLSTPLVVVALAWILNLFWSGW